MSRIKSLVVFVVVLVLAVFALLFALQLSTSSGVKASLEAYLSEQTGLTTRIEGDVNWRYLWPTAVTLNSVSARNDSGSEHWIVETLRLEISTPSILQAPRKPEQWKVSGFKLAQLQGERQLEGQPNTESDQVAVDEFWIRELQPEQAAPFAATLSYRQAMKEPVDFSLNGKLRFIASERRLHFEPAMISGDVASGECNADITLRAIVESAVPVAPEQTENTILNVDLWRRSDWDLKCELAHVSLLGASFEQVSLHSNNFLGNSQSTLQLPVFFSGSAQLNLAIDASSADGDPAMPSPKWVVAPTATNLASHDLITWLQAGSGSAPAWHGPMNLSGRIETRGNSRPAMIDAAQGELLLTSNNGSIDLRQFKEDIKEPLQDLSALVGKDDAFERWPDTLEYLILEGRWTAQAGQQQLSARLDNLLLDASAEVDADMQRSAKDRLAARGTLTFRTDQAPLTLPVPDILQDLPLPFTCAGSPTEPQCQLDAEASKQLLTDALKGDGPAGLSKKIDDMIDEKVPEQYRRAARSLLEILGHSIDDEDADELEDFLGEDEEAPLDDAAELR